MINAKHKMCDKEQYNMLRETLDIELGDVGYTITIHAFKDGKFHIDVHDDKDVNIILFTEAIAIREECNKNDGELFHYYTFKGEQ